MELKLHSNNNNNNNYSHLGPLYGHCSLSTRYCLLWNLSQCAVQSQLTEAGANCSSNWEAAHSAYSLDVGTIDAALSLPVHSHLHCT